MRGRCTGTVQLLVLLVPAGPSILGRTSGRPGTPSWSSSRVSTSVQAPAQQAPPAAASWETGRRSGDLSTRSATLDLSPAAVTELGPKRQGLLGGFLWRHEPGEGGTEHVTPAHLRTPVKTRTQTDLKKE